MKTLLEILNLSADWLARKGLPSPRLEAEVLIATILGVKRLDLYLQFDRPITQAERASIRLFLERRGKREPLQYILQEVEFLECRIKVSPAVLIPRPETEILADKISQSIKEPKGKILWDVCCGSGCLGISLKKRLPELTVILSDISYEACEMTRQNGCLNQVEIEVRQGDLLQPFSGEKAHFVVSNPPYISDNEFESLQPEVKDYEPKGALVSGGSGQEFYVRFAKELPSKLFYGAAVWFELGPASVEEHFTSPTWLNKKIEIDWAGLPRFLLLNFKEDFRILST